jgi:hypothetical protein
MGNPMTSSSTARRLAYADPVYPGQEDRYRGGRSVNLPLLVAYLRTFDGWALSTSAAALLDVWKLCPEARCAAWSKTLAGNGWSRVRWSWEPVLFVTDRRGIRPGERSTVWDSLVAAPVCGNEWCELPGRAGGEKPHAFVRWMLDLLDYRDGDELVDVFPGSGAVTYHAGLEQLTLA